MPDMNGLGLAADTDPRVLLAIMVVGLTAEAAQKIWALLHQNSSDDAQLAAILAETERRIARRENPTSATDAGPASS